MKHTSTLWDKAMEKFMGTFQTKDPFHVEVHSYRGCGNCHWWCPEDHDCSRPGDCDHLSGWRPREDNT